MPSVCRRIVVLLVVALVAVGGPVTAAFAQGAGDQQYQDPFGNSDSGSGSSGSSGSNGSSSSGSSGSGDSDLTPLSPAPQTSGSGTSGSSGSATSSGTTTSPATAGTLPNTGLDTRVLLLAGAVLLLAGVGLRMRNAPERF